MSATKKKKNTRTHPPPADHKRTSIDLPSALRDEMGDALLLRPELRTLQGLVIAGLELLLVPLRPHIAELRRLRAAAQQPSDQQISAEP